MYARQNTGFQFWIHFVYSPYMHTCIHYRIRRMKIVVDDRRVGKGCDANNDDETYTAYFSKRALNRENVLHELYHHISNVRNWTTSEKIEEKRAKRYVRRMLTP